MKKYIIFLITVISMTNIVISQNNSIQIGGKGNDAIYDMCLDENNNKYVTGYFQGKYNNMKAKGGADAFIAKYNNENKLIWFNQVGSDFYCKNEITEFGRFLKLDSSNNSYVLGLYYNSLSFGDNKRMSSKGKQDVFLIKYDENGERIWARTFGTKNNEGLNELLIDNESNIYAFIREETKKSNNKVYKYNSKGDLLWSKSLPILSFKSEVKKIEFFDNSYYMLEKDNHLSRLLNYDLNGNLIKEVKLKNSIYNIESFSVKNHNSFYLIGNNENLFVQNINSFGDILFNKNYNELGNLKPKNILNSNNNIYVNADYIGDSNDQGSILFQLDDKGDIHNDMVVFSSASQNKITKIIIENDKIYTAGQFYNDIKINDEFELVSNGKIDGFITSKTVFEKIKEIKNSSARLIRLYPNPNDGRFFVKNYDKIKSIEVYDLNGKRVYHKENIDNSFINISDLNNAVYNVIFLSKDNSQEIIKLVIDK